MHRLSETSVKQRRVLRTLNISGFMLVVALVVLLLFEYSNLQRVESADSNLSYGISSASFQLEREFLLLRGAVDRELATRDAIDWDKLQLRHDLFLSRIDVVQNGVGSERVRETPSYLHLLPKLEQLVALQELVFSDKRPDRTKLSALLLLMDLMVPDMNILSMAAAKEVNRMQDASAATLLSQHRTLVWVVVLQIFLLLGAAAVLLLRLHNELQERDALRQLAQELSEANALGEAAIRGKNQFLANMSHELRTPLNGMLGMLGLLEGTQVDAAQLDYIQTARGSARHLLVLLNDILDISSLEAGKMTLKRDVVRLSSAVADVQTLVRPLAQAKGLGLAVTLGGSLPLWVLMDETRVKQILLNLLSNAVKFSDTGTIRLSVHSDGLEPPSPGVSSTIWLEVTDQGIGMDQATCDRLFQRFEQGDSSSTRRHEGSGLGLEISRNLSRLMEGDITVASTPGRGSTFSARLQLVCADAPLPQTTPVPAETILSDPAYPLDIVVAEDNSTNRKFLAALLDRLGHKARFAEDGEQAVAMVNRSVPDLVLMDMHMPVMDGIVATKTLRASPGTAASVPIVALSADVMPEMQNRAREAGINGFLSKPLDVQALQSLLGRMFPQGGRIDRGAHEQAPYAQPAARLLAAPAPVQSPAPTRAPAPAQSAPRQTLRPGAMVAHLNLNVVGEVCLIVGRDGYQDMLHEFAIGDAGNLVKLMAKLRQGEDPQQMELAHSVKGEAATLGLVTLSQVAAEVEKCVAEYSPEQRKEAAQQLNDTWQLASTLLERLGLLQPDSEETETPAPAPIPAQAPAATAAQDSGAVASDLKDKDDLVQLIYCSTMRYIDTATLKDIHRTCVRNNGRNGITGMLLYANTQALQVLEGSKRDVQEAYQRIEADVRHRDLLLIAELPQTTRHFSDWSTGVCKSERGSKGIASMPHFGGHPIDLRTLVRPGQALLLLQAFAAGEMGIY